MKYAIFILSVLVLFGCTMLEPSMHDPGRWHSYDDIQDISEAE
jgi:hypothetical protein